jgi:hypothetical protein
MEHLWMPRCLFCNSITTTLPKLPQFQTIYISGGKKNKLNKIDIVGFLLKRKIRERRFRLIEVKDFISFAAVSLER